MHTSSRRIPAKDVTAGSIVLAHPTRHVSPIVTVLKVTNNGGIVSLEGLAGDRPYAWNVQEYKSVTVIGET